MGRMGELIFTKAKKIGRKYLGEAEGDLIPRPSHHTVGRPGIEASQGYEASQGVPLRIFEYSPQVCKYYFTRNF